MLSIGQVVISNWLSTTGITLGAIEDELKQYKEKNALLEERFLHASSLTSIASTAAELGFVEKKSRIVLTDSVPLALKR
ncbi:MAG: hypothetical protein A3J69_01900 [Candidatus Levybacteria bacterium RIFCSPHIGHO2_02_FULL_42_12]|nr:MAG: hypothetical protein A3J69_01900 [Candidatus Levybacteria bacterium RIFCSPHIGHO2_02_FULL_42_12]